MCKQIGGGMKIGSGITVIVSCLQTKSPGLESMSQTFSTNYIHVVVCASATD